MATELAEIDAAKTQSAEEGVADFLFGKAEPEEQEEEFEYEAGQEPVVEGDDETTDEDTDETTDEDERDDKDSPEFVEVEYDGKLYEVPTELKDALLRNSDYTQKTQEVSTQRKEVDVLREQIQSKYEEFQFAESIRDDVSKAEQLNAQVDQYHNYLRENIDTLSHTDIEKLRMAIEDAKTERDKIGHSIQGKQQEFQQAQKQLREELLKKGTDVLKSKIPNWGESHQKQVIEYGTSLGFTQQELNSVLDPREVEVLWKASQYDALQAGKASAVKKVQTAPTIKSRARDSKTGQFKRQADLKKALKSNMPSHKKADLIGNEIASKFF